MVEIHLGIVSIIIPRILSELQLAQTSKQTNLEPVQHGSMERILVVLFMNNFHMIILQHFEHKRFPTIWYILPMLEFIVHLLKNRGELGVTRIIIAKVKGVCIEQLEEMRDI
jgi:hypothetical protein